MTREEWLLAGGYFLAAHGVRHFRAVEIADVGRRKKQAVLQPPPPDMMLNALRLIEVLEWLRAKNGVAPVDVLSWYRDPAYNAAVGGKSHSVHLVCAAADIVKRGWHPLRTALTLLEHPDSARFGIGLYEPVPAEKKAGFVHVDVRGYLGRPAPARWSRSGRDWWRT